MLLAAGAAAATQETTFWVLAIVAGVAGLGMVLARKKGKLPWLVEREEYQLEYGTDCIEIHKDSIRAGDRCLIVDDLLATGGTCAATTRLVERLGGKIVGCAFMIELAGLAGRKKIAAYDVHSLVIYEGE